MCGPPLISLDILSKCETLFGKDALQSAAADTTTEDDIYTRKRKAKARGRSMMTLTGPRGLRKDEKLTLGRPSLLGS